MSQPPKKPDSIPTNGLPALSESPEVAGTMLFGDPVLERSREEDVRRDVEHLHGPELIEYGTTELVLVCLMRDGEPWLKDFLEHHFALGIRHTVLLDNGSEDDTVKLARGYENVTVLRTTLPFKTHKEAARRYLLRRFGSGRWILYMDIDEMFDYPYSDIVSIRYLLEYLNRYRYTAVVTQTLEMFPENASFSSIENSPGRIKDIHRYYDLSGMRSLDYLQHRENQNVHNTVSNERIKVLRGGIQTILSGHVTTSTRHTLLFMDDEIEPMMPSVHWVKNARVADFTGLILHYRFTVDFRERVMKAVLEESHGNNSIKYKKYLTAMEETPDLQIRQETSRELCSVDELVDAQFLTVSEEYMVWVDEKESENPTPERLVSRPSRLGEAFSKSRVRGAVELGSMEQLRKQMKEPEERAAKQRNRVQKLAQKNDMLTRQLASVTNRPLHQKLVTGATSLLGNILSRLRRDSR